MDNLYGAFTQLQNRFLYLNTYWDQGFYSAVGRRELSRQRSCSQIFWVFLFVFRETFSPIPQQRAMLSHALCYCCISAWRLTKENSQSFVYIRFTGYQWQNKTCFPCKDRIFFPSASSYFLYIFFSKQWGRVSFAQFIPQNSLQWCGQILLLWRSGQIKAYRV